MVKKLHLQPLVSADVSLSFLWVSEQMCVCLSECSWCQKSVKVPHSLLLCSAFFFSLKLSDLPVILQNFTIHRFLADQMTWDWEKTLKTLVVGLICYLTFDFDYTCVSVVRKDKKDHKQHTPSLAVLHQCQKGSSLASTYWRRHRQGASWTPGPLRSPASQPPEVCWKCTCVRQMETTFFYNIPLTCVVKKRCTHVAMALCHALLCGLPSSSFLHLLLLLLLLCRPPSSPPLLFSTLVVTSPAPLVCFSEILQTRKAFQRSPNSVACLPYLPFSVLFIFHQHLVPLYLVCTTILYVLVLFYILYLYVVWFFCCIWS